MLYKITNVGVTYLSFCFLSSLDNVQLMYAWNTCSLGGFPSDLIKLSFIVKLPFQSELHSAILISVGYVRDMRL